MTMDPNTRQRGLLDAIGLQKMQQGAQGETGQRFYQRPSFGRFLQALGAGANQLTANPDPNYDRNIMAQRKAQFERRQMADQRQKVLELAKGYGPRIQALAATSPEQAMQIIGQLEAKRAMPKAVKARATAKDRFGVLRYVDTGESVFPSVEGMPEKETRFGFQNKGSYSKDGVIIGDVIFDPDTGEHFQQAIDGSRTLVDMSELQPVTDSFFNIGIPTAPQFSKLKSELSDDRQSLKRYAGYVKNIGTSGQGFERLADSMSAHIKTLLSTKGNQIGLTEQELALKLAQGELQGLIGRSRIETVGGGVMTEQDALRIISNLGGDVNLLQNQEIVKEQIKRLFDDKLTSYDGKLKQYNIALDARYRGLGYPDIDPLDINASVFDTATPNNDGWGPAIVVE